MAAFASASASLKLFCMKTDSAFQRVAKLPALEAFCRAQPAPEHAATLPGLFGGARALVIGALARARFENNQRTSVILALVDSAETALDLLGDLRSFRASEEALPNQAAPPASNSKTTKLETRDENWAEPGRGTLPEDLRAGLPLEAALFPAWDVLPTEADRPEGLTLAGRQLVLERLKEIRDASLSPKSKGETNALPQTLIILAPIAAVLQPVEGAGVVIETVRLRPNSTHDPIALGRKLGELGYERTGQVEIRGEYALRGGILDVYPYTAEQPFRIDFNDRTHREQFARLIRPRNAPRNPSASSRSRTSHPSACASCIVSAAPKRKVASIRCSIICRPMR